MILGIGLNHSYQTFLNAVATRHGVPCHHIGTMASVFEYITDPTIIILDYDNSPIAKAVAQLPELLWPWPPKLIGLGAHHRIQTNATWYAIALTKSELDKQIHRAIHDIVVVKEPYDYATMTLMATLSERVHHMLRVYKAWFQSLSYYQPHEPTLYCSRPVDDDWCAMAMRILQADTGAFIASDAPPLVQLPALLNNLKGQWLPFRFRKQLFIEKSTTPLSSNAVYELFPNFKTDGVVDPPLIHLDNTDPDTVSAWLQTRLAQHWHTQV